MAENNPQCHVIWKYKKINIVYVISLIYIKKFYFVLYQDTVLLQHEIRTINQNTIK